MKPFVAEVNSEIAELLGVLLGDGCISRFVSQGRVKLEVAFTGNESEVGYYKTFLKHLVEELFPIKGQLRIRDDHSVRLHFRSKRLATYFRSIGLPLGKKKDASIPLVTREKRGLIVAFVRGFYHAEGSIYRRYSRKYPYHARKYGNLLVVQFRCKLKTLMFQLHKEIKRLGIRPTRLTESKGAYTFRLTD